MFHASSRAAVMRLNSGTAVTSLEMPTYAGRLNLCVTDCWKIASNTATPGSDTSNTNHSHITLTVFSNSLFFKVFSES